MGEAVNRNVFRYFNGVKDVYGDPLRIRDDLYILLGDPDAAFEAAWGKDGDKSRDAKFDVESARASKIIMDNAREAFDMAPFDKDTGQGATDEDVYNAVEALFGYFEKKSENTGGSLSSSPSTTSTPTACPTKPSSD